MKFKITHLIFDDHPAKEFTEKNPPSWLLSNEFKWWWEDYVLKLKIGKFIKSDFSKIERVA